VNMNRNIYNYKWVNEQILPVINRTEFAHDFAISIEQKQSLVVKLLGDKFNQTLTDVIYYRDSVRLYKDIPHQKYQRLWNAFCFTYWDYKYLSQAEVDQWGYIKYKDIGYEPTLFETADDAYAIGEKLSSSEPNWHY
jgi:hypothetical protein